MRKSKADLSIVTVPVNIDLEDIVNSLVSDKSHDDLMEFIKHLDLAVGDWDFTERLHKYFVAAMEELEREERMHADDTIIGNGGLE